MTLLWWLLQHQQMSFRMGIGSVDLNGAARRPLQGRLLAGSSSLAMTLCLLLIACLPSGDRLAHDLAATSWW